MKFNPIKAGFYLVAGVIALHGLVILVGYVGCIVWFDPTAGTFECDKSGKLSELLTAAMAATLAFVGGFIQKGKTDADEP